VTYTEASERGLRFHVTDYAIPESRSHGPMRLLDEVRGPARKGTAISMLWLNMGPSGYVEEIPR
jgi:hypothetical protein